MKITILSHNFSSNASMRSHRLAVAARFFAEVQLIGPAEAKGIVELTCDSTGGDGWGGHRRVAGHRSPPRIAKTRLPCQPFITARLRAFFFAGTRATRSYAW